MDRKFHKGVWDCSSVFVFGSNLAGRHGRGAARFAVDHCKAVYGEGVGRQGDSYAIPTKDHYIQTLPLPSIKAHVEDFIRYAIRQEFEENFFVTAIGTGLAGYSHTQIAPMFKYAPDNCVLPIMWKEFV